MPPTRPGTSVQFDQRSLATLMHKLQVRRETERRIEAEPTWATPVPMEVGIQLTYRCNLRCIHCYQWNEEGLFQPLTSEQVQRELPLELLEKVLAGTQPAKSKLYLWGGEPLMHSRFDELVERIAQAERPVNLCTNGLLIDRHLDALRSLGTQLVLFVSVDGLEPQHDRVRGRGTFARTAAQLEHVLDDPRFTGEVTLSCMVADATIGHLYAFAEWAEQRGVGSVYFQLPWYIGPETRRAMDAVWAERFAWLGPLENGVGSWHSYAHRIDPSLVPALREDMARVAARKWKLRIRYQPETTADELGDFVAGGARPAEGRTMCLAIANRLEVLADGQVSACKFFPEFVIGDLRRSSVSELWHGERFKKVRGLMRELGLMPICSKCTLLYQNGA
jgi:radical SAM protein with 4Fe4S-binding SPASM domain